VFSEVRTTSVERTLGITGGNKFQHVVFVVIESGMALFAIQLVRFVVGLVPNQLLPTGNTVDIVIGINEMFNGIAPTLILLRVSLRLSFEGKESLREAVESLRFNNPPSDTNTLALQRGTLGSRSSMLSQERNEDSDIYLNNPSGDPNTLRQMGSSSSMPPQERNEDTLGVFKVENATT